MKPPQNKPIITNSTGPIGRQREYGNNALESYSAFCITMNNVGFAVIIQKGQRSMYPLPSKAYEQHSTVLKDYPHGSCISLRQAYHNSSFSIVFSLSITCQVDSTARHRYHLDSSGLQQPKRQKPPPLNI